MGVCILCRKPAWFFQKEHVACRRRFEESSSAIIRDVSAFLESDPEQYQDSKLRAERIAATSYIDDAVLRRLYARSFASEIKNTLSSAVISREQEAKILAFVKTYGLTMNELDPQGEAMSLIARSCALRDLQEGRLPNRLQWESVAPVNLKSNERIIWAYRNVKYLEDKTLRRYVGGSSGVSMRVAKGLYVRTAAYKGQAVESTNRVHVDTGTLIFTNEHVYFSGPLKGFRVPYSKIVAFQPYSDGFGLTRDSANARQQTFVTDDGVSAYLFAVGLSELSNHGAMAD